MAKVRQVTYAPSMLVAVFYWVMVLIYGIEDHNASVEERWELLGTLYLLIAWFGTICGVAFVIYLIFKKKDMPINF